MNHTKLSTARYWAINRMPYMATALRALRPLAVEGLGTFAVTDDGRLLIDPVVLENWSIAECGGVLLHEVLHVVLGHSDRAKAIGTVDAQLWNYAGDAEINDDLVAAGVTLPSDPVVPSSFGQPDHLTAEVYYAALTSKTKAGSKHGAGECRCGSGAGNKIPQEPEGSATDEAAPMSPAEIAGVRRQTATAVKEHVRRRGTVPAGLQRWADVVLAPPQVSWQSKLSRHVRAATNYVAGMVEGSYLRPSRRQGGLGYGANAPRLPSYRAPAPRVAVVLDTSGSMSDGQLSAALQELAGIMAAVNSDVTWCVCDAQVHGLRQVRTAKQASGLIRGGGGTDFRPAFSALEKMPAGRRPQVVVFATDGFGPAPETQPSGMRTIWLLLGSHSRTPASWGTAITVRA